MKKIYNVQIRYEVEAESQEEALDLFYIDKTIKADYEVGEWGNSFYLLTEKGKKALEKSNEK